MNQQNKKLRIVKTDETSSPHNIKYHGAILKFKLRAHDWGHFTMSWCDESGDLIFGVQMPRRWWHNWLGVSMKSRIRREIRKAKKAIAKREKRFLEAEEIRKQITGAQ